MNPSFAKVISIAILLISLVCIPLPAKVAKRQWRDGLVLAADLSGHGPSPGSSDKRGRTADVWWTYCISTDKITYTAVLRASPSRAGLKVNSTVRLSATKDRIYVVNRRGEQYVLWIRRLDEGNSCR